jgi:uncharacterized protein
MSEIVFNFLLLVKTILLASNRKNVLHNRIMNSQTDAAAQALDREASGTNASIEQIRSHMLAWKFHPHPLLWNRHLMTMAAHFVPREFQGVDKISQERLFQVAEGTRMLTHCGWQNDKTAAPTVIVVHGLEGSSTSKYALGTALKAYNAGFNVVRINQRGCGNTFHLSPTPYHAGLTGDIRAIIDELVLSDGISEIYIVGFSLGGNQSLKLAGEYGDAPPLVVRAVCAVSVPIDLALCADALHWPKNWLYEWNFLFYLHSSYKQRRKLHPDRYNLPPAWRALSMRKLDNVIVGPCNGFRDANDYYDRASSGPFLKNISIPTLIIQAKDDPFIPFEPFERVTMSESVMLLATDAGGHVGYIGQKAQEEDRYWVENRSIEFFQLVRQRQALNG